MPQEIENCDGVAMYVKIMEHLNGQRGRDVDAAKEAINNYRMNESITFKQEKTKFEDIFKTLECAEIKNEGLRENSISNIETCQR